MRNEPNGGIIDYLQNFVIATVNFMAQKHKEALIDKKRREVSNPQALGTKGGIKELWSRCYPAAAHSLWEVLYAYGQIIPHASPPTTQQHLGVFCTEKVFPNLFECLTTKLDKYSHGDRCCTNIPLVIGYIFKMLEEGVLVLDVNTDLFDKNLQPTETKVETSQGSSKVAVPWSDYKLRFRFDPDAPEIVSEDHMDVLVDLKTSLCTMNDVEDQGWAKNKFSLLEVISLLSLGTTNPFQSDWGDLNSASDIEREAFTLPDSLIEYVLKPLDEKCDLSSVMAYLGTSENREGLDEASDGAAAAAAGGGAGDGGGEAQVGQGAVAKSDRGDKLAKHLFETTLPTQAKTLLKALKDGDQAKNKKMENQADALRLMAHSRYQQGAVALAHAELIDLHIHNTTHAPNRSTSGDFYWSEAMLPSAKTASKTLNEKDKEFGEKFGIMTKTLLDNATKFIKREFQASKYYGEDNEQANIKELDREMYGEGKNIFEGGLGAKVRAALDAIPDKKSAKRKSDGGTDPGSNKRQKTK